MLKSNVVYWNNLQKSMMRLIELNFFFLNISGFDSDLYSFSFVSLNVRKIDFEIVQGIAGDQIVTRQIKRTRKRIK